ncbi:hypothetical protein PDL71_16645 [Lacibacter sp. MH-610]|uniref:hypothetical protein n=1 Tax=Lacibacter sp. MH-610 TaxID=3020883 RepID=UPI003892000D
MHQQVLPSALINHAFKAQVNDALQKIVTRKNNKAVASYLHSLLFEKVEMMHEAERQQLNDEQEDPNEFNSYE